MNRIVGIPKEIMPGEKRVAGTPETVSKIIKLGMEVWVEKNAGEFAYIDDKAYQDVGAKIVGDHQTVLNGADIILKVERPIFDEKSHKHELDDFKEGSILIAPLYPLKNIDLLPRLNKKKITAFSLDLLPRIARAQSMDILSSMSNLLGYKSVIMAADILQKIFPMMITAAGTIQPAKVIVIGAGVAGLQAIATARRLGAVVIAFDTRPDTEVQVKSLGAEFVSLKTSHEQSQDAGGYAKEQSVEFYREEQGLVRKYSKEADIIITTALIPGKRAPLLITKEMVSEMQKGSVIVDLAALQEGNCELTEPGKVVIKHDVTIIGILNMPSTLPVCASQMYAKNLFAFLNYIAPALQDNHLDFTDDIIKGCLITFDGVSHHPLLKQLSEGKSYAS
jgi:NAD(P) transhydrogenase subunit alpha